MALSLPPNPAPQRQALNALPVRIASRGLACRVIPGSRRAQKKAAFQSRMCNGNGCATTTRPAVGVGGRSGGRPSQRLFGPPTAPAQKRPPARNLSAGEPRDRPGFGAGPRARAASGGPAFPWCAFPSFFTFHHPPLFPSAPTKRPMDKSLHLPTPASMSSFLPKLAFID